MRISIIGTGYVGLTTGAALASLGHQVRGFDINQGLIEALVESRLPFYEPGLTELVAAQGAAGRLSFSNEIVQAGAEAELVFICVGTPPATVEGMPDVSQVEKSLEMIATALTPRTVVVLKSTVPIGTGDKAALILSRKSGGLLPPGNVAVNPEFLREGTALEDFFHPDRVVLGVRGDLSRNRLLELYGWAKAPLVLTDRRTAEAIKYIANAFLATKISFANEVARVCASLEVSAVDVLQAIGLDRRIGPDFLEPGVGFGGSCLPKDLAALIFTARSVGLEPVLLEAVEAINRTQPEWVVEQMERALFRIPDDARETVGSARVAVWGLSFKPGTDDTRSSPALELVDSLVMRGHEVITYDPLARLPETAEAEGRERLCPRAGDPYAAVRGADALILATAWPEFKRIDWRRVRRLMSGVSPVVVDGRNALEPALLLSFGFVYVGVGRVGRAEWGRTGEGDGNVPCHRRGRFHRLTPGREAGGLGPQSGGSG